MRYDNPSSLSTSSSLIARSALVEMSVMLKRTMISTFKGKVWLYKRDHDYGGGYKMDRPTCCGASTYLQNTMDFRKQYRSLFWYYRLCHAS